MSVEQFVCSCWNQNSPNPVPGVRVQIIAVHSPEFYVPPTSSLGRFSIEQQDFPHSKDFFSLLFSPVLPLV